MFMSQRTARWVVNENSFGIPENGMRLRARNRRCWADPPRNESGRTGTFGKPPNVRYKIASSGNGTCIAAQRFSIPEVVRKKRLMRHMRSLCSSSAMTLSTDVSETLPRMRRGKAGQTSEDLLAGVLVVQQSCRFRRRGDPKTRTLHRRHTCTSDCHDSILLFVSWPVNSM